MIIKNTDIATSGLPPEGIHALHILKAETQFSRSKGEEMLALSLETVPGGEKFRGFVMLEGKGTFVIKPFCAACGLVRPQDPNASFELSPKLLRGRYLFGEIVHKTNVDGVTRAQVARYLTFDEAVAALEFIGQDTSQLPKVEQEDIHLPVIVVQQPAPTRELVGGASSPARPVAQSQSNGGNASMPPGRPVIQVAAQTSEAPDTDPGHIPF